MHYKDLKEMTFKEWDGKPFYAIVIDHDEATLYNSDARRCDGLIGGVLVTDYDNGRWCIDSHSHWNHAYPIEWNKKPKKQMTNRQLAMWLAKGNGEYSSDNLSCAYGHYSYVKSEADDFVDDCFRVRKWDSEKWVEPTVDLLED